MPAAVLTQDVGIDEPLVVGAGAQDLLVDGLGELGRLFLDVIALLGPSLGHDLAHARERGHAVPILVREVRPAVERTAVGCEPNAHRPTAPAGECLHRLHVDRVDVGAFLAVDLHVHEQPVHELGHGGILERLVRHHVTPVARRIAHREEDRLALGRGADEGLVAPRIPVDRVVAVLAEIRARFGAESVRHPPPSFARAANAVALAQR